LKMASSNPPDNLPETFEAPNDALLWHCIYWQSTIGEKTDSESQSGICSF
jgi:hypothetical protein